jgi:uncharacterized protein YjbJ (UPF0337 family)
VQPDLQRGWTGDVAKKHGDWSTVSNYASEGFTRGRSSAGNVADRAANATRNTFDRAETSAERMSNKAANAVDDMKDRVDGNPASKPGPDSTDSARRLDNR